MKKLTKYLSLCIALFTLLSICPVAFASEVDPAIGAISPQAEETEWFFRVVDGIAQKRLWSYTEGKWLTDWIDIGTA